MSAGKGSARRQEDTKAIRDRWPMDKKPVGETKFGNFYMCINCYKPVINGKKCPRCESQE